MKAARRFKYLHDNCYGTPRTLEPFKGLPQRVKTHLRRRLDRCRSADVRVTKKKGFLLGKKNCCCTKTEFIFYLIDKRRRLWSKVTSVATSQTDRLKQDRRLPSLHIKHVFFFSLSISNSRTLTVSIHITGAPPI